MIDSDAFIFNERIHPKKLSAVLPQWEELLAQLQIDDLAVDSASEVNKVAIEKSDEAAIARVLDEMYRSISSYPADEEMKARIMEHEPLRLALAAARLLAKSPE